MISAILPMNEISVPTLAAGRREPDERLILLADDDPRIRRFVHAVAKYAAACAGMNADVIEASNARAGLSEARGIGRPIDLLISDVHLGSGKSGLDLAREMSLASRSTRVVLMSAQDLPQKELSAGWKFLSKPFRVSALIDLINPPEGK